MVMDSKFIGKGLKVSGPNLNVLNVLRVLIEDEGRSIVYMPANYERGTRKRVDEHVHHGHRYAPVPLPIQDFVPNMERFNFSVRGLKEVLVENEQTGELEPKKVFRTYNIIRDGELHIDKLEAKLSKEVYDELVAAGLVYDQVGRKVEENKTHVPDYVYTINLSGIPLVSTHWAQPTQLKFVENLVEEAYLTELLKYMNKLKREYEATQTYGGESQESDIYVEKSKYANEEPVDTYEADCVLYRVKGYKHKEINEDTMRKSYPTMEILLHDIRNVKKRLSVLRFLIRAVAFAIHNTKYQGSKTFDWSEPAPLPRSKNKMVERAPVVVNGQGCVLERITWKEDIPV